MKIYRKEIFKETKEFIEKKKPDGLIVVGDFNQDVTLKEMREFYSKLQIQDAHQIYNYIDITQLDNTYQTRSKAIDSIAISDNLIK